MSADVAGSAAAPRAQRGMIYLEAGTVLKHTACAARQHILRIAAPQTARRATPGSFVHLQCEPGLPLRRPLSIMRAAPRDGWIEVLYKVIGAGTAALAARRAGETLSLLGPIGRGFTLQSGRARVLAIGGGVGIPPLVFLAEQIAAAAAGTWKPLVLMGSEIPFPFQTRPSRILVPAAPAGTIACMPLLEEWGVPSRLASNAGYAGCFSGHVTELAAHWLAALAPAEIAEVQIRACGPPPMLAAAARLARHYQLPCEVALEEYMACAVGGCAGCTVEVHTAAGPAMKRVCVDGPVFDARSIFAEN